MPLAKPVDQSVQQKPEPRRHTPGKFLTRPPEPPLPLPNPCARHSHATFQVTRQCFPEGNRAGASERRQEFLPGLLGRSFALQSVLSSKTCLLSINVK